MKLKLVCILFCFIFAFLSCDGNKGDDFSYGDYPDSVTTNDDDYTYVKKDSDTAKKDDDSFAQIDEEMSDSDSDPWYDYDYDNDELYDDDDEGNEIDNLSDADNIVTPDEDNIVTTDADNTVIPDEDNTVTTDEDNTVIPDEDNAVTPDADNTVTPDDTVPDVDTYIEPVCGNFIVEEGEVCEPGVPKPCSVLDPANYQSGWANCLNDCSAWVLVSCVEYPCSEKPDSPDPDFIDSNCDGIDGNIIESVFVDMLNGNNMNNGSMASPVATIAKGVDIAYNSGKKHVLVAFGTYSGSVTLKTGISIHGGYSGHPSWSRSKSNTTVISTNSDGLYAEWVGDLTLSFLTIRSADAVSSGQSSVAMKLYNCANIVLSNLQITAGNGAPGSNGTDGTKGLDGLSGQQGNPGCESSGGFFCDSCQTPQGGAGGVSPCGANGGKGGSPGKGNANGSPGESGVGSTTNGGAGDIAGSWDGMCLYYAGLAVHGGNGDSGAFGMNGSAGGVQGDFNGFEYIPSHGGNGTNGSHGQGGGGGGGGCGGTDYCNSFGSSGGGGGGAGCGGTRGTGGTGGGGSFALWTYKSTGIVLDSVKLETKNGGKGGNGGYGQIGGFGALGGSGGPYGGDGEQDDGGCGGWGGAGGNGGRGGHGGGGGGGPSVCLIMVQSSVEGIFYTNFTYGSGGVGGGSHANSGANGVSGQYLDF